METFRDKARAFVYAFVVHALCIAALFIGLLWTQSEVHPINLPGPIIDVDLVGITAAPRPPSRAKQAPKPAPPKPQPEAVKPPEPQPQPPAQPERNDRIEREKVAEIAQEKADQQRAEEERHKQEQVLLQQQEKQERDRQKQLDEVRKQLALAEKKRKVEQDRLEQLKDLQDTKPVKTPAQPVPPADIAVTGHEGHDDSRDALYFAAIQNAVTNNWLRPDSAQGGLRCMIHIVQIPGGDVIAATVTNPCNADPLTRSSIEQAVKRASPLPYKSFENEFRRDFNLNFTYDG